MTEIEKAFEAGYRAYREAFDHYDDNDATVERSLKWRMAEYVKSTEQTAPLPACQYCNDTKIETANGVKVRCRFCGKD